MNQPQAPLFDSFGLLPEQFAVELALRVEERLKENEEYCVEEIQRVSAKSPRLCSTDFNLQSEDYERLRVLCILSQCALANASSISSHRRFIGPLIVKTKQILWKITSSQLEDSFSGIQEFSSWMLVSQIKTTEKLQKLEQDSTK